LIKETEYLILTCLAFDLDQEHPFEHIRHFVVRFCSEYAKKAVFAKAVEFCTDSYRIPFLCVNFHPKVIATACISLAAEFRICNGLESGVPKVISGYEWFKWVDSAIENS